MGVRMRGIGVRGVDQKRREATPLSCSQSRGCSQPHPFLPGLSLQPLPWPPNPHTLLTLLTLAPQLPRIES